jgi:hypothetical protein
MEKTFLFMIHSTSLRTCLIITIAYFSVASVPVANSHLKKQSQFAGHQPEILNSKL